MKTTLQTSGMIGGKRKGGEDEKKAIEGIFN